VAEAEKQRKSLLFLGCEISDFIKLEYIFSLLCNDQLLKVVIFQLPTADGRNYAVVLRSVTAVR